MSTIIVDNKFVALQNIQMLHGIILSNEMLGKRYIINDGKIVGVETRTQIIVESESICRCNYG